MNIKPRPGDLIRFHKKRPTNNSAIATIRPKPGTEHHCLKDLIKVTHNVSGFVIMQTSDIVLLIDLICAYSDSYKFLHPEHGILFVFYELDWEVEVVVNA